MISVLREATGIMPPLMAGVLILVLLLFLLMRSRRNREKKIINAILNAASIPFYRNSMPELNIEIARSRRYEREFSIIVVQPLPSVRSNNGILNNITNGRHLHRNTLSLVEFLLCGPAMREEIRATDIITYDRNNNRFVLLLPETNKMNATQTITRIKKTLGSKLSAQLIFGVAQFHSDGLIIDELVNQAAPNYAFPILQNNIDDDSLEFKQDISHR